jgi:hypothetical protein
MTNPNLCKIDSVPAAIPHIFCAACLGNWLRIRTAIQQRMAAVYGVATRENYSIIEGETKRLNDLWKRDREAFENEAKSWY